MQPQKTSKLPLQSASDVVVARQTVRQWASELKFSLVDQTKIVTAASELARNALEHGGGGEVTLEIVENGARNGIKLTFEDKGPGIANVEQAMKDGWVQETNVAGSVLLGRVVVDTIVQKLNGQDVPAEGYLKPIEITKDNLNSFDRTILYPPQ